MQLKRMTNSHLFSSVFLFSFFFSFASSSSSFNTIHKCSKQQSDALFLFKQSLSSINSSFSVPGYTDLCKDFLGSGYYPIMMNWEMNTDCCKWNGITCDGFTGDVIGIDLSCGMLQGTIHPNSTLFRLPHLQRLNLAFNDFTGSQIPPEIRRFSNSLTHFNISHSDFEGQIPSEISFLPRLISLDLSQGMLRGLNIQPRVFNSLLQNSTHLRELSLYGLNISSFLSNNISSPLKTLDLSDTGLQGKLPDSIFNHPYLEKLVLSFNSQLTGPLPKVNRSTNTRLKWLSMSYMKGINLSEELAFDSISQLKSLNHLDLSSNNLSEKIADSIGNLKYLNYLHLSYCSLTGSLPKSLLNLTDLSTLDLYGNKLNGTLPSWLFTLPSLETIYLDDNMFSGGLPSEWFNHSSLKILSLSDNKLNGTLPSWLFTLPSLETIYLDDNMFSGGLPSELFNHSSLKILSLSHNKLNGTLPSSLFTLPSLDTIYLDDNMFSGGLPSELFNHSSLKILFLRDNQFDGEINQVSNHLLNLTYLDLSSNNFTGVWNLDTLLSSLPNLVTLDLSYSGLSIVTTNATSYVYPDFRWLGLASCSLTMFPEFLQAMKNLEALDLSSNDIKGRIPDWARKIGGNKLYYLNLSHNSITGLPHFQGAGLMSLYVQYNKIEGEFPSSICNMSNLVSLDMSYNKFVGVIPPCFGNILSQLEVVNMGNNRFHGTIPNVNQDYVRLYWVILNGNQLVGDVPSFLSKAQDLRILDIGNNHLNGTFPKWLGNLPLLEILMLGSNNLHGSIETSFTGELPFPSLQVLDLSHNGLVGHLPKKYFQNFIAMKAVIAEGPEPDYFILPNRNSSVYYSVTIVVKGQWLLFQKVLVNYIIVDLSDNKFEGEIPDVIGTLNSLKVLNLSHNHLNGQIPHALGNLSAIESLDLSWNQLSGKIPQELADIASLEVLNLSQNHLVGHIPKGKQFNTFDEHSFGGNPGLCGFQLPRQLCEPSDSLEVKHGEDGDDEEISGFTWKVVMLGYGCGTITGMVMGCLMLSTGKPEWFQKIANSVEHAILNKQKRRRYIYIGQ